jgi:hypothetical protein
MLVESNRVSPPRVDFHGGDFGVVVLAMQPVR